MEWHILSFDNWCFHAAAHIRFKPDRPAVEQELREHMEDHFNALLAEGKTAQEAERLTLAAMGDADETGAALARVHKPYLGWLYVAAKWVVALSAILLFMVSCSSGFDFPAFGFSEPFPMLDLESSSSETFLLFPQRKAQRDGYTFSVPLAIHRIRKDDDRAPYEAIFFVLEAMHPLPWAGFPEGVRCSLSAVDSAGNLYPNRSLKYSLADEAYREVGGNPRGRTLLRYRYELWISNLDPAAEWVELRYERLGCSFTLCIDLTEGEKRA